MRFESKRDTWLIVFTLLGPIVVFFAIAAQWYVRRRDLHGPIAGAAIVIVAVLIFVSWFFRSTYYVIDGDTLVLRSAFLTWRIPIRDITAVTPTRNPLSSPALSLDRLRIDYGSGFILVSPERKEQFIEALRAVNPAIIRRA